MKLDLIAEMDVNEFREFLLESTVDVNDPGIQVQRNVDGFSIIRTYELSDAYVLEWINDFLWEYAWDKLPRHFPAVEVDIVEVTPKGRLNYLPDGSVTIPLVVEYTEIESTRGLTCVACGHDI